MQIILIIPEVSKKVNIPAVQKKILEYVGTRMINDSFDTENMPGVALNQLLTQKDKEKLSELMTTDKNGALMFIEIDDEKSVPDTDYIDAKLIQDEE